MISILPAHGFSDEILCQLQVHPSQNHFIESIEECLKEARANSIWNTWAILNNKTCVGFAMSGDWIDEQRTWLDRFLIDYHFQGKGFGKAALFQLIEHLIKTSLHQKLYLSLYPDNRTAMQLYQSFGFKLTDEKDIHDEQIMVLTKQQWDGVKKTIQLKLNKM